MVTIGPHSVRATPLFIELCQEYAQHYQRCAQERIEEYSAAIAQQKGFRALTGDHEEVVAARREIARAQVVSEALDVLREELERIYNFHYEQMAELFRQAKAELGIERIEDAPQLAVMLRLTMAMLRAENPKFREEKFINYINNGKETV
jgi:hypothetical protein